MLQSDQIPLRSFISWAKSSVILPCMKGGGWGGGSGGGGCEGVGVELRWSRLG